MNKVATKVIRRAADADEKIDQIASGEDMRKKANRAIIAKHAADKTLKSPVERVVGSSVCHVNYLVRDFMESLKPYPQYWTVTGYYPYADGGPVHVDYPGGPDEARVCEIKRDIMKKIGKRYAVISKDKDGNEMDMQAIAEQLG